MNRLSAIGVSVGAIAIGAQATAGAEERPRPYSANVIQLARENTAYRRVLYTGARSQLVAMSIPAGDDIGVEKHERVEQIVVVVSGTGRSVLDGVESPIGAGDIIVVTPGTGHDLENTGAEPLKLYTVYAPPNHIDGRVHQTKEDAERDVEDEEFGRHVE